MNQQEHERLIRVGKGTPMGEFMRRYWHPVALSSQVAEPDSAPLLTWLLGERLVVFRDTSGAVGVLDDHCAHRGVSLSFGRNEECGLRCLYHGWKFAVDGRIMETPNHDSAAYRERKRARAFPVREQSGLIWTYLGEGAPPPFRTFDFDLVPDDRRHAFRANSHANYLHLWEGGVDSSHVGILHTNDTRPNWGRARRGEEVVATAWDGLAPTYEVDDTDYGFRYVAFRAVPGDSGERHARQVPAILPSMRIIPGHADFSIMIIEVPMTDTQTATYQIAYSMNEPLTREWSAAFLGFKPPVYDEATCTVNMRFPDQLGQDRNAMGQSWSGFPAIEFEDVAMALSLGDLEWDRSNENLVAADIAVMRLRQMLLRTLDKVAAGEPAPSVDKTDMTGAVAYDRVLAAGEDWKDPSLRSKFAVHIPVC